MEKYLRAWCVRLPYWVGAVLQIKKDGSLLTLIDALKGKTVYDLRNMFPNVTDKLIYMQENGHFGEQLYGSDFVKHMRDCYTPIGIEPELDLLQVLLKQSGKDLEYAGLFSVPRPILTEAEKAEFVKDNNSPIMSQLWPSQEKVLREYSAPKVAEMLERERCERISKGLEGPDGLAMVPRGHIEP